MEGGFFIKLIPPLFWSLLYHQVDADLSCHSITANSTDTPSNPYFVRKGGSFILQCRVPFNGFHMWYKDGRTIKPDVNNKFHLEQDPPEFVQGSGYCMTMKLIVDEASAIHTGEYKCNLFSPFSLKVVVIAENIIETNEDESGLKRLLLGQDLVLQCNTTECPQCQLVWYKDGKLLEDLSDDDDRVFIDDETNSVTIQRASYDDSGIYMCAIDREQFDMALNATIEVQTEVKLEKFNSTSSVVRQGQPLELYCNAKASPPPTIKWFRNDEEIDSSHERIKLLEHNDLKNGKLLIEETDFPDRANYSCEAYNRVHSSRIIIFIRIKDKLAALWPFLGICAEVVILCTVIFFYEKRKRSELNENDTDFSPDKNVRGPGSSQTVRQRK